MTNGFKILLIAGAGVIAGAVGLSAAWPSIPGTLTTDSNGKPWGTGTITRYYHHTRQAAWTESYVRGTLKRSVWYGRNGNVLLETNWQGGNGVALSLRQDGSIKHRVPFENGQAVRAKVEYFDPAGKPVTEDEFKAGEADNWGKGGPPAIERDYFPMEPE